MSTVDNENIVLNGSRVAGVYDDDESHILSGNFDNRRHQSDDISGNFRRDINQCVANTVLTRTILIFPIFLVISLN